MPLIDAGLAAGGLGLLMLASATTLVWSIVCSYSRRPPAPDAEVQPRPQLRVIQGGKRDAERNVTRSVAGY
jgi:hypothetical protein